MTTTRQRVFDAVFAAENGIAAKTISRDIGIRTERVNEVLRDLRKWGRVSITNVGPRALWCTPDRFARVRSAIDADVIECRRRRDRIRLAALKASHTRRQEVDGDTPFDRVIRPAAGAPLPRTRAVRSVFELAAV